MGEHVMIDCHDCGGGGCTKCKHSGVTRRRLTYPPISIVIRADDDGFETDRQSCPSYEGICINEDVAQCTHPDNRDTERSCMVEYCPIANAAADGKRGEAT